MFSSTKVCLERGLFVRLLATGTLFSFLFTVRKHHSSLKPAVTARILLLKCSAVVSFPTRVTVAKPEAITTVS